jgi:hypothetical protein
MSLGTPPALSKHGGGVIANTGQFVGAPLLRQRCDARGLGPIPIEIIAKRKAALTFEWTAYC